MRDEDLKITELDGGYTIEVTGRANFDYAVPLRALSEKLQEGSWLQFFMENCETMDSTFMGVLTMLALKLRKQNSQIQMINAGEHLVKLLKDLGVAKLFNFVSGSGESHKDNGSSVEFNRSSSMLDTAETVVEAHKALVGADESNAEKFNQVIEFAEQDVERLRDK